MLLFDNIFYKQSVLFLNKKTLYIQKNVKCDWPLPITNLPPDTLHVQVLKDGESVLNAQVSYVL